MKLVRRFLAHNHHLLHPAQKMSWNIQIIFRAGFVCQKKIARLLRTHLAASRVFDARQIYVAIRYFWIAPDVDYPD
jgi:hypothetical protein